MKLRRNKKGFTIIELVIVIAVIGILAAVLIPTFVNLTNKANEAADNALVNNLNKALKMEEQEPGHQKAPTLEGAIKDLEDQGYILENLASKSGKDLLWSQSENQFLLNTEGKSGKDYWKIVDAVPAQADQKYSYYAGKNFNQTDVTVVYGFDAGRTENISKVKYVGTGTAQEVAIRTNGGDLAVNAEKDIVKHYGDSTNVNIEAVASDSFYEHGVVKGAIYVTKGHVVLDKQESLSAAAGMIVVKGADVNVETKDNTPIVLDGSVEPTAETKVNGVIGTDAAFEEEIDSVVAKINDTAGLEAALYNGGYYALGANIELDSLSIVYEDLSLDLNGKKITWAGTANGTMFAVLGGFGTFTINDSVGGGLIDAVSADAIYVTGYGADEAAKLVINGGTIQGYTFGIFGNGNSNNWNTDVTINGGTVKCTSTDLNNGGLAIYHPQDGILTINGGTLIGLETAVEVRAGRLEVNGGYLEAKATTYSCNPNGNGSTTVGSALAIVQHTTKQPISATISGGTFKGHHALVMSDVQENETSNVTVAIKGGTFLGVVENLADPNWVLVR